MAGKEKGTTTLSITLPNEAVAMLDGLIPVGLYGKRRATIAAQLILDHLKAMPDRGDWRRQG